jgi:hypothetical protein
MYVSCARVYKAAVRGRERSGAFIGYEIRLFLCACVQGVCKRLVAFMCYEARMFSRASVCGLCTRVQEHSRAFICIPRRMFYARVDEDSVCVDATIHSAV